MSGDNSRNLNLILENIIYDTVRIRKLWNRKMIFMQLLSVFDVVTKQIVLL